MSRILRPALQAKSVRATEGVGRVFFTPQPTCWSPLSYRAGVFYVFRSAKCYNIVLRPELPVPHKEIKMIKEGSKVKFDYTLTVDGKVTDTSAGRGPLEYVHGAGHIIPGLEKELLGMKVGDKKTVKVAPEEGYGLVLEEAIRRVPKEAIGGAENLKVGDMVGASNEGHTFRAVVKEITDKEVVLDFNHPLAGKELNFDVEIKEIN